MTTGKSREALYMWELTHLKLVCLFYNTLVRVVDLFLFSKEQRKACEARVTPHYAFRSPHGITITKLLLCL